MIIDSSSVKQYLLQFRDDFCNMLQTEDNSVQRYTDDWNRPEGGGGTTIAYEQGDLIEKAGVNFSHVTGAKLPASASAARPELAGLHFDAMGVSIIVHPKNPFAPTCHANLRLFATETDSNQPIWWFGGGFDLTPFYGFDEDCKHWHQHAKSACEPYGKEVYPRFKKWADEYFYLKHRNEARGIGGLFFDDLNEWGFDKCFAFVQDVGTHFIQAYQPILHKRKNTPYEQKHRDFQCYRRGRYVEFNLILDRGTLFGLQSNGRTESLLSSLPPIVNWRYNWQPESNSEEAKLYEHYLQPNNWAALDETKTC